jgi:acyl carrier protein
MAEFGRHGQQETGLGGLSPVPESDETAHPSDPSHSFPTLKTLDLGPDTVPVVITERADREAVVRGFFLENFPLGGDMESLRSDASLLEAGVIDSTGVLELIGFLEETFGIAVPDEDLLPENFDSISNILDYLDRRLAA